MIQWLRLHASIQGVWIRLVKELRSLMLHGMANKHDNSICGQEAYRNAVPSPRFSCKS